MRFGLIGWPDEGRSPYHLHHPTYMLALHVSAHRQLVGLASPVIRRGRPRPPALSFAWPRFSEEEKNCIDLGEAALALYECGPFPSLLFLCIS